MPLQPQLISLLGEVRAFSRKIQRAARMRTRQAGRMGDDVPTHATCLVKLFDDALVQSSGREQIICLAAAVELGVLRWHHLSHCAGTAGETSDRALRALYWATSTRWHRANASQRMPEPLRPRSPAGNPKLCEHCQTLRLDCRRYSPHAAMKGLHEIFGMNTEVGLRQQFRCEACDVLWVRRMPTHEPFATWSVVPAGTL
ncbi:hypothetical protein SGO26_01705 [Cupriavidus metallidurans]|uniref:hypothetical protein n=1 Tax=Cupriavidus TaxID=106589 RepID=UPI000E9B4DFB|nr:MULTISPECIES: hypothetical protein [unclassified Cupriavidus]HBD35229.1 hypothetical protein [Cupriavidus sp.]HBO82829.1 hypothetical protein [Cupriavidus sp.]